MSSKAFFVQSGNPAVEPPPDGRRELHRNAASPRKDVEILEKSPTFDASSTN
jgi:hypothetical protein